MINFVQSQGFAVVGANATANFASVNKGDLLLAFFQVTNANVTGITDSQGNVWTFSENQHVIEVGSPFNLISAWAIAGATGACVVTLAMSVAGGGVAFGNVVEYSTTNVWAANPITTAAFRDVLGGNPNQVGAMAGPKVGSLVLLWGVLYTTGCVWSALTAGFTMRFGTGAGSVTGLCDWIATVGGPSTPQMNLSVNQNTFAMGFVIDEVRPLQQLTPQMSQIIMNGYDIQPIEEE